MAWDPPPLSSNIYASEVMSHPAVVFKSKETVGKIIDTLRNYTYNGFPVVDDVYGANLVNLKLSIKNSFINLYIYSVLYFLFRIILNLNRMVVYVD